MYLLGGGGRGGGGGGRGYTCRTKFIKEGCNSLPIYLVQWNHYTVVTLSSVQPFYGCII